MLELRPGCEHCDRALPPDSADARICSYECTFCRECVEQVLENVCPNCGGGFVPRPVRPATDWKTGVSLAHQPASGVRVHKPLDRRTHAVFAARLKNLPPSDR
ncbi:DUF1272 domain-containing protein [Salinisphaera sp.]|uniref:DUF1272 domain-containing protein n=1 Tax=Salinisphaera sp. TaxID=1914330 RepID=UPI000C551C9C|nr:urease [Salinisphaera sp.]|tara:strand:- start:352 stop:660 length:309 start_codon:yes stop_codon:yes gene_type:complete